MPLEVSPILEHEVSVLALHLYNKILEEYFSFSILIHMLLKEEKIVGISSAQQQN